MIDDLILNESHLQLLASPTSWADLDVDILDHLTRTARGSTVVLTFEYVSAEHVHARHRQQWQVHHPPQVTDQAALHALWPYARMEARRALQASGLPSTPDLPFESPFDAEPAPAIPAAPTEPAATRPALDLTWQGPLPTRVLTLNRLHARLDHIIAGKNGWLLATLRLYVFLLLAEQRLPEGVELEYAPHWPDDIGQLFFEQTGVTSIQWANLTAADRQQFIGVTADLLPALIQAALDHDVDEATAEVMDDYRQAVDELLDDLEPAAPSAAHEAHEQAHDAISDALHTQAGELGRVFAGLTGKSMRSKALMRTEHGRRELLHYTQVIEDRICHVIYTLVFTRRSIPFEVTLRFDVQAALRAWHAELDDRPSELPQLPAVTLEEGEPFDIGRLSGWADGCLDAEALNDRLRYRLWNDRIQVPRRDMQALDSMAGVNRTLLLWQKHCPAELLEECASHGAPEVRRAVAWHRKKPAQVTERLSRDPEPKVRQAAAATGRLTEAQWRRLLQDDPDVVAGLASRADLTPERQLAFAAHPSADVRAALAGNYSVPADLIEQLACDDASSVREQAATHPELSSTTLAELCEDEDWAVSSTAEHYLRTRQRETQPDPIS